MAQIKNISIIGLGLIGGSIAKALKASDNNFVMFKGDNKTINVKVYIPSDAEYDKTKIRR